MAAAWPAGRASPAAGPPGLLRTLWLVAVAAGHWGAAASGAIGSEETPKCEDLRVGQYPPERHPSLAISRTRGCGMGTEVSDAALVTSGPREVRRAVGTQGRALCALPLTDQCWHFLF
ncbi:TM2 domain-containing protein 1 [Sigmodon hispidus]